LTICLRWLLALAVMAGRSAHAQDSSLVKNLRDHSAMFNVANWKMNGAGADSLASVTRANHFIMVGEDHGIREVPEFVAALFDVARPAGYTHIAVEIGPLSGAMLETMMSAPNSQQKVEAFLSKYSPYAFPFFFWKEESGMLERIVKSVPGANNVVWGLDQEFMAAPTYLLEQLGKSNPFARAQTAASRRGDSLLIVQANPSQMWMMSSSDRDIARLRSDFRTGPQRAIVDELAISRAIYRSFMSGQTYAANQTRDDLMKKNFVKAYTTSAKTEETPKAIIKLGANHVFRGPSTTHTWEIGSFVPEFAIEHGGAAFGILAVAAKGTWNAYRPLGSKESDKTAPYNPLTTDEYKVFDMASVLAAANKSQWTYIDLRPAREQFANGRLRLADEKSRRLLMSFDAVVVIPEAHASVYFR
jgi:hypothetical protein